MTSYRTVSIRSVSMWCERQWWIATILAAVFGVAGAALILADSYRAGATLLVIAAINTGAAVMAAQIGRRFGG